MASRSELGANLASLHAEGTAGRCLVCDGPVPPAKNGNSKRRVLCLDPDCKRTYQRAAWFDWYARRRTQLEGARA